MLSLKKLFVTVMLLVDAIFLLYFGVTFDDVVAKYGLLWAIALISVGAFVAVKGSNYLLRLKGAK
jgi:hypothetical protein